MEKIDRMLAEWECTSLCHAFAHHLDHRDYAGLAGLFTPDGVWIRHGQPLRGREQIVAVLEKRQPNQFTRHVTTGFHFTHMDETTAKSVAYNISYFSLDGTELPLRYVPDQAMVLDFIDQYVKTPHGWRFSERITKEVLIPDAVRAILAAQKH